MRNLAGLDHVLAEAGEVAGAGAAGVDRRRHAGGAAELLRVDAERGAAPVDAVCRSIRPGVTIRSRDVANVGLGVALELRADLSHLAARERHVRMTPPIRCEGRSRGRRAR